MYRQFTLFLLVAAFALLVAGGAAFAQGQALDTPTIDANSVTATSFQPEWAAPYKSGSISIHPTINNCLRNSLDNCYNWLYRFEVSLSESFAELDRRAARNNSSRLWEAKNNTLSVCSAISKDKGEDDREDGETRKANCNFLQPNKTYSVWIRINGRSQNPDGGGRATGNFVYKYYEPIEVTLGRAQGRVPGRVQNLRVSGITFHSVDLSWRFVGSDDGFEAKLGGSPWISIGAKPGRADSDGNFSIGHSNNNIGPRVKDMYAYALSGGNSSSPFYGFITDNTSYTVSVRAVNANGAGGPGSANFRTPKRAYPPRHPALAQPSGSAIGTDRVRLSWTHDTREDYANGVGPFRRYRVRVWTDDSWVGGFYTNSRSFTVTGLYPQATYHMNVYAEGPEAPRLDGSDETAPIASASNTITVTTAAPPAPSSSRDSQGSPGDQDQSSVGGTTSGSSQDNSPPPQDPPDNSPPPQDPPPPQPTLVPAPYTVPQSLIDTLLGYQAETHYGDDHVLRWTRALAALGHGSHANPMTLAEAKQKAQQHIAGRWDPVVDALEKLQGG